MLIVFIHGWSVIDLSTYGELPLRLQSEATKYGIAIQTREIFLGRYISFHDEVRIPDVSLAFETAVRNQLKDEIAAGQRFVCITHSTGGPLARDWWKRFYTDTCKICPMSHLIMMAPANFGSALAQLGKEKIGRLKAWFDGVEPGQGILDWLELGSSEAWELNRDWIFSDGSQIGPNGVFPFVITGEYIDRKLYDHLNSYTGELGSDGVVRTAAANLQSRYIKLTQSARNPSGLGELQKEIFCESPKVPMAIIAGKSHSGTKMGIMNSIGKDESDVASAQTIQAIFSCIGVKTADDYALVYQQFSITSDAVQKQERIEPAKFLVARQFIHNRYSMVIFRVLDSEGLPVRDFDLILTAGKDDDPNHLPEGFFVDRQQNRILPETITYFFDFDVMTQTDKLGLQITPRPQNGFVRYAPAGIVADDDLFRKTIQPNSTTLIEIRLERLISTEVFHFEKIIDGSVAFRFDHVKPGDEIV